jgi:acyl dehydratase
MLTDSLCTRTALEAGSGTGELRFRHPVRPGDTLSGTVEGGAVEEPTREDHHVEVSFKPVTVN